MPRTLTSQNLDGFAASTPTSAPSHDVASDKQKIFLADLLRTRVIPEDLLIELSNAGDLAELARRSATYYIGRLMSEPRIPGSKPVSRIGRTLEPGAWLDTSTDIFYTLTATKNGLGFNVKTYDPEDQVMVYLGGAAALPPAARKATIEEAAAEGRRMVSQLREDAVVFCCVCGTELTHPDSRARGIGPICAGGRA